MVAGLPNKRALLAKRGMASAMLALFLVGMSSLLTSGNALYINLSNTPGDSLFPSLAASGHNLYLAWDDDSVGDGEEIFFVRSVDGGGTFGSAINISNNAGISRNPELAAFDLNVYAVWEDDTAGNSEIFYSVSRDGGLSFMEPINLSRNSGNSVLPSLAVSQEALYVVWQDNSSGNDEIYLTRSFDHGRNFSTAKNISKTAGFSWSPAITVDGSHVYIAWEEESAGLRQILLSTSADGAETFGETAILSQGADFSTSVSIGALSSSVYVTWTQEFDRGNYEVMLTQSTDAGNSFNSPQNISQSTTYSGASVIALSERGAQLAWVEGILANPSDGNSRVDYDIFVKQIDKASSGIVATPQNLSATDDASVNPALILLSDGIYGAWADYTSGNFEILFARQ